MRWGYVDWHAATLTIARSVYEVAGGGWAERPTNTHQVRRVARKANVPTHLHALRHFSATQAIGAPYDAATVGSRRGHADPPVTLRVYGHALAELWDWTLAPGDRHASEAHSAGTEELLQVHQGTITVEVEVGGQSMNLGTGDALAFPGDVTHSYANPEKRPARFSLAVFEPGGGSRAHPEAIDG